MCAGVSHGVREQKRGETKRKRMCVTERDRETGIESLGVCVFMYVSLYLCICMRVCVCACVRSCACACLYVCVFESITVGPLRRLNTT